jgi:hypothetical protein
MIPITDQAQGFSPSRHLILRGFAGRDVAHHIWMVSWCAELVPAIQSGETFQGGSPGGREHDWRMNDSSRSARRVRIRAAQDIRHACTTGCQIRADPALSTHLGHR